MPTRPAARAPKAWLSAIRSGIAVIGTRRPSGTPMRVPRASATMIRNQPVPVMAGLTRVAMMAIAKASSPTRTLRRAVVTEVIHLSESAKPMTATR